MKKVIITGFGAFHTHSENPSEKLLSEMAFFNEDEICYKTFLLPVSFSAIPHEVRKLGPIEEADAIVFCGLAAAREEITPEKIALNWAYSPHRSDNEGTLYKEGRPLIEGRPLALMSTFDAESLSEHLNSLALKSSVSFSAGTYVCNQVYYEGLNLLQERGLQTPCLFLHLPPKVPVESLALALHQFFKK